MPDYTNPLIPKKKPRTPTYYMTDAQLNQIRYEATRKGITEGIHICNTIFNTVMLTALHDKLRYGRIRLERVFGWVQGLFDEVMEERIVYTDLMQMLKDECGINLIIKKPNGVTQDALELLHDIERPARIQMEVKRRV